MTTVAERIERRMRELGMVNREGQPNVKALAEKTDSAYSTLNDLVRGRTKEPSADTLRQVADALDTTVDWLLGGEGFDLRAYQKGREDVADAVERAVREAMDRGITAADVDDFADAVSGNTNEAGSEDGTEGAA